jgi:ATP-binding protein involved in chromosome partitioning
MGAEEDRPTTRDRSGAGVPEPRSIDVDRDAGVTLEWEDHHVSRFGLEELRVNCQCAACGELRRQGVTVWPRPGAPQPLRIESAELVGAWAVSFVWNDNHRTGIYPWESLRAWCHCPECAAGP